MKRPAVDRPVRRTGDVRRDLTENQLAWIGSVALAYNETEMLLDIILTSSIGLSDLGHELASRVNGTDGKAEIIKVALKNLKAEEPLRTSVAATLGEGGFAELKKYRDRIIHARIQDAKNAIARSPAARGKFEEILLTPLALEGVYKRLVLLRSEMLEIMTVVIMLEVTISIRTVFKKASVTPTDDPYERTEQTASRIQECLSRLQQHRKDRLSLPPLPEFPSESELSATDAQAAQAWQAEMIEEILGPSPESRAAHPPGTPIERRLSGLPKTDTESK